MATKRRIEITVETQSVTVSQEDATLSAWCAGCHSHVLMIGLGQASRLSGLSWREIVTQTDARVLHCYEPGEGQADGRLLICLASLSRWLQRAQADTQLLPLLTKGETI